MLRSSWRRCASYRGACSQPIDGQIIARIGELAAGLTRVRSLAVVLIGIPGRGCNLVEFRGKRREGRVLKLREEASADLGRAQARARHSFARRRLRHRVRSSIPPRFGADW